MNKQQLPVQSFVSTLLAILYILAVALFMTNAERWFGQADSAFSAAVFLMLFSLSALIVGSLFVAKPLALYIDGQKKDALQLLLWNGGWLFVFFVVGLLKLMAWNAWLR